MTDVISNLSAVTSEMLKNCEGFQSKHLNLENATFALCGVLMSSALTGWQTATYLSILITVRVNVLVNML